MSFCSPWLIKQPLPAWIRIARLHWHLLVRVGAYESHDSPSIFEASESCLMQTFNDSVLSMAAFKTVTVISLVCQIAEVILTTNTCIPILWTLLCAKFFSTYRKLIVILITIN